MRWLITIISLVIATVASGQSLRLILVPQQTTVLPDRPSKFDIYLFNDGTKATKVPSLQEFTATYTLRRQTGEEEPAVTTSSRIFSHPLKGHSLAANRFHHAVVEISIEANIGDLVELHIEVGDKPALKTNSVLLYRPIEQPMSQPASSPKAAITPQRN